jgi:hypothetical protein
MANRGQGGWTHAYSYAGLRIIACLKHITRLRTCLKLYVLRGWINLKKDGLM